MKEFNNIENRIITMETKLDIVIDSLKENKIDHKEMRELIFVIDNRKADKAVVEEIRSDIRKVVWIVLGGVLVAVLGLVFKQ